MMHKLIAAIVPMIFVAIVCNEVGEEHCGKIVTASLPISVGIAFGMCAIVAFLAGRDSNLKD